MCNNSVHLCGMLIRPGACLGRNILQKQKSTPHPVSTHSSVATVPRVCRHLKTLEVGAVFIAGGKTCSRPLYSIKSRNPSSL